MAPAVVAAETGERLSDVGAVGGIGCDGASTEIPPPTVSTSAGVPSGRREVGGHRPAATRVILTPASSGHRRGDDRANTTVHEKLASGVTGAVTGERLGDCA